MFWNRYLLPSIAVLLLIAILHIVFIHFYIYWRVRWVDIPMHIFAGMWIVLTLAWILGWMRPQIHISLPRAIMWGLIVGGLWEIGELVIGINSATAHGYVADTMKDLFDDVFGAVLGYCAVSWIYIKEKIQNQ